ncbi:trichoplein keratin filament-binding protein isoform X2 [Adelges cooleyi]|uniref:trichoplein keratin filament-binding protein isoform X2 n=1 Tax=Adelges cooleyi TaxID=133065 RepID=UPI00217FC9CE|nr:trichoplein keratin filament-binding protein isoform X2 [Adelges cooleyi]
MTTKTTSKTNRRPNQAQLYEALHKKHAAECEAREQWAGITQYFKTWENNSNKFTTWTSPEYYKKSSELQLEIRKKQQQQIDEERKETEKWLKKIQDRQREDEDFKKEQMKKKPVRLSRPTSASHGIPNEEMAKELLRKQDAVTNREKELKLYARSKSCDPKPKEYERRLHQRSTKSSWDDQMKTKQLAKEKELEELCMKKKAFEEELIKERIEEEQKQQYRLEKMEQIKTDLIEKVAKLRACSDRCEELKKLESTYLNFQTQLSSMEQVKNKQEQLRLNNIMRSRSVRQYQTVLKQKSKEILECMQEDDKLLNCLIDVISSSNIEIRICEKLNELKQLFKHYENEESHKLYLMDFMFEEEAKNMWHTQEERWKNEHTTRKNELNNLFKNIYIQRKKLKHVWTNNAL